MRCLIDADPIKYAVASVCQTQMYLHHGVPCELKQNPDSRLIQIHYPEAGPTDKKIVNTPYRTKLEVMSEHGITTGEIELESLDKCLHSVKLTIQGIMKATGCKECTLFLTRGENFRFKLYSEYKAGRPEKPLLVPKIEEYMQSKWDCVISEEIEADDALGIEQCRSKDTILVSVDKDLDMIPGWHHNPTTRETYFITPEQGLQNFWMQVLTGDKQVDNIPGLPKVGKSTAKKILDGVELKDMREVCLQEYLDRGFDEDYFVMNCRLLWMLRKPLNETYPELYGELYGD